MPNNPGPDSSRPMFYLRDKDGNVTPLNDRHEWERFCAQPELRQIAVTDITSEIYVSTIFLGLDRGHGLSSAPVLWETRVFGGVLDEEMERYTSEADAIQGHAAMVQKVRQAEGEDA